jgi:hypothetical protein
VGVLKECIEVESEKSRKEIIEKRRKKEKEKKKDKEKKHSSKIKDSKVVNKNDNEQKLNETHKIGSPSIIALDHILSNTKESPKNLSPRSSSSTPYTSPTLEESLSSLDPSVFEDMRRNQMMEETIKEVFFLMFIGVVVI